MKRTPTPGPISDSQNVELDVLLNEYNNSSVEYGEVLSQYRQQISLLNYYVTIFTGVLLFLFTSTKENTVFDGQRINTEYIFAIGLTFSLALLYYIYSNAIDIVYNLYLVEGKRATLEKRINRQASAPDLLNWDSDVVRHFNEDMTQRMGWLNPSILTAIAGGSIVIVITAIHCFLAFLLVPSFTLKYYFTIIACIISAFLLHQFVILHSTGKKYIFDYIYSRNAIQSPSPQLRFDPTLLPIVTFFAGAMAFVMFSIREDAFWYTSPVDLPYVFIWSMSIGDTFLLPVINYKLGNLIFNKLGMEAIRPNKPLVKAWGPFLAVIAIATTAISHYAWAIDPYSDFIAIQPGVLTIGGWWHLVFSGVQAFLFGVFFLGWFLAIRTRNNAAISYSKNLWWWVFSFALLMIANFIHQYLFVFDQTFFEALVSAKFTLVPVIVAIGMRAYLVGIERKPVEI